MFFQIETLKEFKVVYIPCPPMDVNIYFHVYISIIEELGIEILEEVSKSLVKKYSTGQEPRLDEIIKNGIEKLTVFSAVA